MACVEDFKNLSPDESKILEAIQDDFLSTNNIVEATKLPMFRVRSVIRKLIELDMAMELNEKYKAKAF